MSQQQINDQITDDAFYDDLVNKDILDLMGYKNLTEEEKKGHYARMLETIQNRVICRIDDALSGEDQKEWMETVKNKTEQEKLEFLKSKEINLDQFMAEETLLYKTEIVQAARDMQKALKQDKGQ